MNQWFPYLISAGTAIAGLLVGRAWERHDRRTKRDQALLDNILSIVPVDSETIEFLRTQDFGDSFERELIRPIHDLRRCLQRPDCFFLDSGLEQIRTRLLQATSEFTQLTAKEVFPTPNPRLLALVRPEEVIQRRWAFDRHEPDVDYDALVLQANSEFDNKKARLNSMADNICRIYDKLIRTARKKL